MFFRFSGFLCISMLVAVTLLAAADTAAPTQLHFLGTGNVFAYNKHDKSFLLRQTDCSLTQYSFYPLLALTPSTNFQNTLHQTAGLTSTGNKFLSGCKDPTLGIASTAAAYLGKTSSGVYQAVRGTIASSANLVVDSYNPTTLSSAATTLATNVYPQVLAVDLNGDGFIDVIATGVTSTTTSQTGVGVFLNNGDGTFKPGVVYPLTTGANQSFIVDDVNGDGVPDLIVPNTSSGGSAQLTSLIGDGHGGFTVGPSSPVNTLNIFPLSQTLVTGDFNGDHKIDVLMADGVLYLGNGDGAFGAGTQALPGDSTSNAYTAAFAVGDFNGDGKLDLAQEISWINFGIVNVFLGNGSGAFTQGSSYEVVPHPAALVATDIDGDGVADLVVARASNGAFSAAGDSWFYQVLMGHGIGTFDAAPVTPVGPFGTGGNAAILRLQQWVSTGLFATADFDGDGRLDLIQPQASGTNPTPTSLSALTISVGKGDGSFGIPIASATNFVPAVVAAGDLNGDGKIDAVSVGANSAGTVIVGVLFGSGGVALSGELDYPLPAGSGVPARVLIADFDGDGVPDIAVAILGTPQCTGCTSSGVYVLYGKSDHTFAAPVLVDSSRLPIIAAGDLNADGKADLVVADAGTGSLTAGNTIPGVLHVYLGRTGQTFASSTPTIPTLLFSDLQLVDINKDGKLDIVTGADDALGGNTQVATLLGVGDGTFAAATTTVIAGGIADPSPAITVADFDGDGNPDVAFFLAGDFSGVLFGIGNGSFPTQVNMRVFSPQFAGAATAVDLNGDHKPDLLFADANQFALVSLLNQWPVATVAAGTTTTLSSSASSVAAGQSLTLTATVAASAGGSVTPAGTVTFLDGSTTLGFSSLDTTGKATFTVTSLAPGSHALSATYGGSTAFSASASSVVAVQIAAAGADFTASVNPASVTVAAGASGTFELTVTPIGGSTQTVSISCGGLPANATCGFSPGASVTLSGTTPSTITVTIATNALAALHRALNSPTFAAFGGNVGGIMLMLMVFGGGILKRSSRATLALIAMWGLASCHGGNGGAVPVHGATPAGTYPLTITLTSGATTHTANVTLIVN